MLSALAHLSPGRAQQPKADWLAATMLFAYVAFFSFAYLSMGAATGALILFGAVQLTMFAAGRRAGEQFAPLAWLGLALVLAGLLYLVSPGLTAPRPLGAILMSAAGVYIHRDSLRHCARARQPRNVGCQ